jgi:hypothetical protein
MNTAKATTRLAYCSLYAALLALVCPAWSRGDDFRVENRVYADEQRQLNSHSTTIFHGDAVYDFLTEPAEIVVFDKAGSKFVLLDLRRRVRTELRTVEVTAFVNRIREWAYDHPDPLLHFQGDPKFDEQFDAKSVQLTLKSPLMIYEARLARSSEAVSRQYRQFCDWYAELNTVLSSGSRPPFARLMLDEAIARRNATVREVKLTIIPPSKPGTSMAAMTVSSRHELTPTLSAEDLRRVEQAREHMRNFTLVKFADYHKKNGR